MPTILYPVVYWGLRLVTKGAIEVAIRNGALTATSEAVDRILKMLVSNTVVMALNVGVIVATVHLAGGMFNTQTSTLIISTIYFSSVLYGLYSFFVNIPTLAAFIFIYNVNLSKFLEAKIYREAYIEAQQKIDALNPLQGLLHRLWGKNPTRSRRWYHPGQSGRLWKKS